MDDSASFPLPAGIATLLHVCDRCSTEFGAEPPQIDADKQTGLIRFATVSRHVTDEKRQDETRNLSEFPTILRSGTLRLRGIDAVTMAGMTKTTTSIKMVMEMMTVSLLIVQNE